MANDSSLNFGVYRDTGIVEFDIKTPKGHVTFKMDREYAFDLACAIILVHRRLLGDAHGKAELDAAEMEEANSG